MDVEYDQSTTRVSCFNEDPRIRNELLRLSQATNDESEPHQVHSEMEVLLVWTSLWALVYLRVICCRIYTRGVFQWLLAMVVGKQEDSGLTRQR